MGKVNKRKIISHSRLIELSANWLRHHKENARIPNCTIIAQDLKTIHTEIPDVIGWGQGQSVKIEVKISHNDFKVDRKKRYQRVSNGMGNYRMYCCPKNIIQGNELPANWGLLYYDFDKIKIVKMPEYMNESQVNKKAETRMLISIIRRMKEDVKTAIDRFK